MNIEEAREYILTLPNVEEVEQFADVLVYKVGGKWFAVYIFERPGVLAVKCDPDRAIELRDRYAAVTPAWHFNKRHWNDLLIDSLPATLVKREIVHSYLTVIHKNVTPKSLRTELLNDAEKRGITDAGANE